MFPNIPPPQLSKKERKLCKFYKKLGNNERKTLLLFAEFLSVKYTASDDEKKVEAVLQQPVLIKAAENESVVKGIKRLKASYFMIDNENLLHEVSALMSEHVMKGVPATEVIQRVEAIFEKFYQQYKDNFEKERQGIE